MGLWCGMVYGEQKCNGGTCVSVGFSYNVMYSSLLRPDHENIINKV